MAVMAAPEGAESDKPRTIVAPPSPADRAFRVAMRGVGLTVLLLIAGILIFLVGQSVPIFRFEGFKFFTTAAVWPSQWGIAAILPMGVLIALIALIIAVPLGVAAALFISEYCPARLRGPLIALVDLMAAIPSIIVALFGLYFLMPRMIGFDAWISHHLAFIPLFHFTLANAAGNYANSTFIAGSVVSVMVTPIICSLTRQVFSQAPQGEREAAYALGSTKWGMVCRVVLPFGRSGIVGASMLGLGRALGETIAVSFILAPTWVFDPRVLETKGNSVTAVIADYILGANGNLLSALFAAGLALFLVTLMVNTLAAIIISRSRSGATVAD